MIAETPKQIMIAHNLQFLFLASLSNVLALFFILNAVSLIFEDFDYNSCLNKLNQIETLTLKVLPLLIIS